MSAFYYCLCNPGFEARLKAEAAAHAPQLHPSFSRPGLVTFKAPKPRQAPRFTFARVSGRFLGKGTRAEAEAAAVAAAKKGKFTVHTTDLRASGGEGASGPTAAAGSRVWDQLVLGEDLVWWGERTVEAWGWGCPGGFPNLELPPEAPSRAWLKAEEMLAWSAWDPPAGLEVIELGSAPGGASWALLQRGLRVTGVDVAPMAEVCLAHPAYTHVALSVRDLRKTNLPEAPAALFCDLGLAPYEAIPQIRHLCQLYPSIQRLYYTLKLGQGLAMAELDRWRDEVRRLGFTVRSTHLPSNRQEILVAGVRSAPGAEASDQKNTSSKPRTREPSGSASN